METKKFIELAKNEVVQYHNEHQEHCGLINESHVFVVWSCKTLQNHKALLGVAKPDGDMYYEATYDGDCCVMYLDAYKKEKNTCIQCDGTDNEKKTEGKVIGAECKMGEICAFTTGAVGSPYKATVKGMLSTDYKERFKAEYQQTKIRYEKLKAFCNRIEAAMRTCPGDTKRVAMPEHDCPLELLRDQQRAMGEYLHCLEIRAVIEGIEL